MRRLHILAGTIGAALLGSSAFAQNIVTPNDQASVEGNSHGNFFPTNTGQQVLFDIASSQFTALSSGDVITGLAFRPDVNLCDGNPCGAFAATELDNVTIELGTTSIAPTTSDTTFADYLTTNLQTVFTGNVTVSSAYSGPADGPKTFDIMFPFTSTYAYNPADGNLVVDIIIDSDTGMPVNIDAVQGTTVQSELFGTATGLTGNGNSNVDIIDFATASLNRTPVPEPATWLMMIVGLGAIGIRLRARRGSGLRLALG